MYPTQKWAQDIPAETGRDSSRDDLDSRAILGSIRYGQGMSSASEPLTGRIPIRCVTPNTRSETFAPKSWVNEVVPFRATIFKESHELLGAELLLTDPTGSTTSHRLRPGAPGSDLWEVSVALPILGTWSFCFQAWADDWASWLDAALVKIPAGIDTELTLDTGAVLLHRAVAERPGITALAHAFSMLSDSTADPDARFAAATNPALTRELEHHPLRSTITTS